MKRRTLLQAVPTAGLLSLIPFTARSSGGSWRTFEVVTRVEVAAPTGQVMVWVPLPLSQDTDWFQTLENSVTGNFTVNQRRDRTELSGGDRRRDVQAERSTARLRGDQSFSHA